MFVMVVMVDVVGDNTNRLFISHKYNLSGRANLITDREQK